MNAVAVADTLARVIFERFGDIQLYANDGVLREGTNKRKTARILRYQKLHQYYSWLGVTIEHRQFIATTGSLRSHAIKGLAPNLFEVIGQIGTPYTEDAGRLVSNNHLVPLGLQTKVKAAPYITLFTATTNAANAEELIETREASADHHRANA